MTDITMQSASLDAAADNLVRAARQINSDLRHPRGPPVLDEGVLGGLGADRLRQRQAEVWTS